MGYEDQECYYDMVLSPFFATKKGEYKILKW